MIITEHQIMTDLEKAVKRHNLQCEKYGPLDEIVYLYLGRCEALCDLLGVDLEVAIKPLYMVRAIDFEVIKLQLEESRKRERINY